MIGERVLTVYRPKHDSDWFLIETDRSMYSLRLGGFRRENLTDIFKKHEALPFAFAGQVIQAVYTDSESTFIVLSGGGVITQGFNLIDYQGRTYLAVGFQNISEYEPGFFESADFYTLAIGEDDWSHTSDSPNPE